MMMMTSWTLLSSPLYEYMIAHHGQRSCILDVKLCKDKRGNHEANM